MAAMDQLMRDGTHVREGETACGHSQKLPRLTACEEAFSSTWQLINFGSGPRQLLRGSLQRHPKKVASYASFATQVVAG